MRDDLKKNEEAITDIVNGIQYLTRGIQALAIPEILPRYFDCVNKLRYNFMSMTVNDIVGLTNELVDRIRDLEKLNVVSPPTSTDKKGT